MALSSATQQPEVAQAPQDDWHTRAACQGMDTALFFPAKGQPVPDVVKATCARCPVRVQCLAYAIETHQSFGVWGGLTVKGRRRYIRQVNAKRARY